MNAYLRALRGDPRFVACVAAILPLLLDDVPEPRYGTFRDPGGALVLSLIFADAATLMWVRRAPQSPLTTRLCQYRWLAILVALPCKYIVQPCLYVRNAGIIDSALLFGSHWLIAFFASPGHRRQAVLRRVAAGTAVLVLCLCLLLALSVLLLSWENKNADWIRTRIDSDYYPFDPGYFPFALMRALVPYTFWTAVLGSIRTEDTWRSKEQSPAIPATPPAAD